MEDIGSKVRAEINISVGILSNKWEFLIEKLVNMFVIYFNNVISIATDLKKNKVLEFRGVLSSFLTAIILLFPSVRHRFTAFLTSRNDVKVTKLVAIFYSLTGSYFYSKLMNHFTFVEPSINIKSFLRIFLLALQFYITDPVLQMNFLQNTRCLKDTQAFIVLLLTLVDNLSDEHSFFIFFDYLVSTSNYTFQSLGLTLVDLTGFSEAKTIQCYALSFYRGLVFYLDGVEIELQFVFLCIVLELHSSCNVLVTNTFQALSPWDARVKPHHTWDIYWRCLSSFALIDSYDYSQSNYALFPLDNVKFRSQIIKIVESVEGLPLVKIS